MGSPAQRWVTTVVGAGIVAFCVWIVARNFHPPEAVGKAPATDGGDSGAQAAAAFAAGDAASAGDDGGTLFLADLVTAAPAADAAAGATLPDGTPVPPLPFSAPRQVRFGVVLVTYADAQPSATGTRPAHRSKADAKSLADRLAATATQDFRVAVQQGDPGSTEDLGQLKAGILEPAPEYILFTLPVGAVGGPVDTPRGYWIVKRLE
jgi:hypothetical protein